MEKERFQLIPFKVSSNCEWAGDLGKIRLNDFLKVPARLSSCTEFSSEKYLHVNSYRGEFDKFNKYFSGYDSYLGALNKGWRNEPISALHDKFKCRSNFIGTALEITSRLKKCNPSDSTIKRRDNKKSFLTIPRAFQLFLKYICFL